MGVPLIKVVMRERRIGIRELKSKLNEHVRQVNSSCD